MKTIAKAHFEMSGADLKAAYRELKAREVAEIERLIDAAMAVLHHDRSEGTEVDIYERNQLRERFAEILRR
jgi:hypothetical protein